MMPKRAEIVIIGGGIIGCATAYHLAKLGMTDVVVLERSYLASGSTGRCGAGVRHQWGTEMNCLLAQDSIRQFETLSETLDYPKDIEFKQGGYLILAWSRNQWRQLEINVKLQQKLGIEVEIVDPAGAQRIVPHLNTNGLIGASFCPRDGHVNPFLAVDAYARAARRLGVTILTGVQATGIEVERGQIVAVDTCSGRILTPRVMNAAGPYSQDIARLAGIELPTYSERHQILVTEPVAPIQGPMVLSFAHGLYCQQVPNGNFLIGLGEPDEQPGYDIRSSWLFLQRAARVIREVLPPLGQLRVLRQWAGLYNMSPDRQPIIGGHSQVEGYWMAVGYSGHGFMVAPTVTESVAAMICGQTPRVDVSRLGLDRFERGELIHEPAVV